MLPEALARFHTVIALTHVFLPFMVMPIMSALQGIDPALESAARSLGAGRTTIFRRVILPLSVPGVQAGVILVFVLGMGAYVTPAMIGAMRVKTMPVTVVRGSPDSRTRSDRVSGPEHSSSASSSPALPPGSYGIDPSSASFPAL